MPPRHTRSHARPRRPGPPGPGRELRAAGRIEFVRRVVPLPPATIVLTGPGPAESDPDRWELLCRDGWEWRFQGPGQVVVRVATISAAQALVVHGWLERIKSPAVWWAVSRELQAPDSAPEVAAALRADPWLAQVLPVLLEASVDGAPPPPPA